MGILDISFDMAVVVRRDQQALHGAVSVNLDGEQVTGTFEHFSHHQSARHGAPQGCRSDGTGIVSLSCLFCQISGSDRKSTNLGIRGNSTNHIVFVFIHK